MGITPNKIKTIFIGTPDFAVPSLHALINDKNFDIIAVITKTDKKVGRKQTLTSPPVKIEALKYGIKVLQPEKISDFKLGTNDLDLIVVAAYSKIIPKIILNLPKFGCINVHASLLPKYRGASPIQAAILNGDKETGITIMKMDEGLDTGQILAQEALLISAEDTGGSLFNKLSGLGAKILIPTLAEYTAGKIKPVVQDNTDASYAGILKKKDGRIDWTNTANFLERFIRAMNPWPGAFSCLKIKNIFLKILETEHDALKINNYKPGEIFLHNEKIAIQCGQDSLIIKKLQQEGKKAIEAEEFLRGWKNFAGEILE